MTRAAALVLDVATDLDRMRRAVEQAKAVGGDLGWLGGLLDERLSACPDARLAQRDDALAAMAQTYVGRLWTLSGNVSTEMKRYSASAWRRRDRNLDTAPSEYLTQPRKLAAFNAMRADPKADGLGQKQISRILGHRGALSMSIASEHMTHHKQFGMSFSGNRSRRTRGKIPTHHTNEDRTLNALTPQSNAEFIEALKRAPAGQAVIKGETTRVIDARQKLIDAMVKWDADALKTFPKLDAAIQTEIAATRASEAALRAQNVKLSAANFAKSGAVIAYDQGRQRIEAELRATPAGEIIDEFQRDMRLEIDAAMKKHEGGRVQENRPLARDPHERILIHSYGNRASVAARLDAIHSALAASEALRVAADQGDIVSRLDALRAGLPAIESAVIPTFGGVTA